MPQAIPFIVLAATAVGTGVAVAGQIEQAEAAEKAGKYNQKVADNNAQAAADQARYESDRIRKRNMVILGRQKAAIAKAGILDAGSTIDVFMDSAIEGELDRMAAIYSGRIKSDYYVSQGRLARMSGDAEKRAGYYRAAGTLLSGAGAVARQSYNSNPSFED